MADVYLALAHFPVYNKNRETIASALTTIDLHDLARVAATYSAAGFYVVTPLKDQRRLAEEMIGHWRFGRGAKYNPARAEALSLVSIAEDIEEARSFASARSGKDVLTVGTSAASGRRRRSFKELREMLSGDRPLMVVFGTAWGLTNEALDSLDYCLEPVTGPGDYNHLSVRCAAGIIMDRLLSPNGR